MESAIEFLFRRYMDNKQKLTLADFIEATMIEEENIDKLISELKNTEEK